MFARSLLRLVFVLCALPALATATTPEVAVKRIDSETQQMFDVSASGTVKASPAAVWKVLTDYEAMPDYVPDLKMTRVMSRSGNRVVVEQAGVARFLFLRRSIHLVVSVTEDPISSIDIELMQGDMKVYSCRWELTPIADTGGTRIAYTGKLVPKFYVPGVLGTSIIRRDIERMMTAVLVRLDER